MSVVSTHMRRFCLKVEHTRYAASRNTRLLAGGALQTDPLPLRAFVGLMLEEQYVV